MLLIVFGYLKVNQKKIILEMFKFFSSRLATLGLEMLIMFVFVTLLGLNTDMWVVIWTLVAQVLIIIMNYVLSKLVVFKDKKIRNKFSDKEKITIVNK